MTELEYYTFTDKCSKDLAELQENLKKNFDISWYENWFYDQSTGLFTLSTDDKELNFKYISVGTYSRNTNTWKWSWDNETSQEKNKSLILKVKDFGHQNEINQLTTGYFEATEQNGWDFTAITANLLNGIGSYRAVDKHLLLFMVLTEFVDKQDAQLIKDKFISCGEHGSRRRAFICRHLNKNVKTGFEESFDSEPEMELDIDDDLSAWCDKCESVRTKEGEWNDKSMAFADIRLVCEDCYFDIKEINLGHK